MMTTLSLTIRYLVHGPFRMKLYALEMITAKGRKSKRATNTPHPIIFCSHVWEFSQYRMLITRAGCDNSNNYDLHSSCNSPELEHHHQQRIPNELQDKFVSCEVKIAIEYIDAIRIDEHCTTFTQTSSVAAK